MTWVPRMSARVAQATLPPPDAGTGAGWGALVGPRASSGRGRRGLWAGSEPSQSTQGPDAVESSALSFSTVQLRSQCDHGVVTSGPEPGPAARLQRGRWEVRGVMYGDGRGGGAVSSLSMQVLYTSGSEM